MTKTETERPGNWTREKERKKEEEEEEGEEVQQLSCVEEFACETTMEKKTSTMPKTGIQL